MRKTLTNRYRKASTKLQDGCPTCNTGARPKDYGRTSRQEIFSTGKCTVRYTAKSTLSAGKRKSEDVYNETRISGMKWPRFSDYHRKTFSRNPDCEQISYQAIPRTGDGSLKEKMRAEEEKLSLFGNFVEFFVFESSRKENENTSANYIGVFSHKFLLFYLYFYIQSESLKIAF